MRWEEPPTICARREPCSIARAPTSPRETHQCLAASSPRPSASSNHLRETDEALRDVVKQLEERD